MLMAVKGQTLVKREYIKIIATIKTQTPPNFFFFTPHHYLGSLLKKPCLMIFHTFKKGLKIIQIIHFIFFNSNNRPKKYIYFIYSFRSCIYSIKPFISLIIIYYHTLRIILYKINILHGYNQ